MTYMELVLQLELYGVEWNCYPCYWEAVSHSLLWRREVMLNEHNISMGCIWSPAVELWRVFRMVGKGNAAVSSQGSFFSLPLFIMHCCCWVRCIPPFDKIYSKLQYLLRLATVLFKVELLSLLMKYKLYDLPYILSPLAICILFRSITL